MISLLVLISFSRTFLEQRLKNYMTIVKQKFPYSSPLIILFDNCNIYRGVARFARLRRSLLPIMCNLTVRAALVPNLSGIEYLWEDISNQQDSQRNLNDLTYSDLTIGNYRKL